MQRRPDATERAADATPASGQWEHALQSRDVRMGR